MNKQHRRIISKYKGKLTEAINWRKLLPKLIEYGVLDDENVTKRWRNPLDIVDNNQRIYSRILDGGPNAFDNFIQSLIDIGHRDLAAIIHQPVEKNGAEGIHVDPEVNNNREPVAENEVERIDVDPHVNDNHEPVEENQVERIDVDPHVNDNHEPVEDNEVERIDVDPHVNNNHEPVEENQAEGIDVDLHVNGNSEIHDREEIIEEESSDESDDEWPFRPHDPTRQLEISVKKSKKFMEPKGESCYYMQGLHRGIVLIINNFTFACGSEYRAGAILDRTNIIQVFEQMGGFEIQLHENLTAAEIISCLAEFAAQPQLRWVNSMFVFVMSHGRETVKNRCSETMISGTDGEFVTETDILEQFTTTNCVEMANKPKILVFQNCRGGRTQQSVNLLNDTACTDMTGIKRHLMPASPSEPGCTRQYSDILVGHATVPGHVAYRHEITGSWYIQILCEVFMKRAHNTELLRMFQMVDRKMSRTVFPEHQTSSVTIQGFYKECYMNPGYFEP